MDNKTLIILTFVVTALWDVILRFMSLNYDRLPSNLQMSFVVLLISMLLADIFVGFYNNMLFVYTSLFFIAFIFFKISHKLNYKNLFFLGFIGSFIFYLITNFGVWALGSLYEKNINGLIECYILAIPFFKNTLISTIIYSYLGIFSLSVTRKFKLKN